MPWNTVKPPLPDFVPRNLVKAPPGAESLEPDSFADLATQAPVRLSTSRASVSRTVSNWLFGQKERHAARWSAAASLYAWRQVKIRALEGGAASSNLMGELALVKASS
ncbi:hypothetical protein LTR27_006671 [Elasticomyces elasticus]|nr:hypothetical protein LTR27_006671 [Elasticomyces elasticus]